MLSPHQIELQGNKDSQAPPATIGDASGVPFRPLIRPIHRQGAAGVSRTDGKGVRGLGCAVSSGRVYGRFDWLSWLRRRPSAHTPACSTRIARGA
jgi:hypothetical protein